MFNLLKEDIHLAATANSKKDAILQVFSALTQAGYVKDGYIQGVLNREHQATTFLGNGIAIPHGTPETRDQILKTGVAVFQFPKGVDWGEKKTAYVVIGIAAKSNQHLTLLRQLTHVISDKNIAQAIAQANQKELLCSLLMGKKNIQPLKFDSSMITLNADVKNINSLQAINIIHLQDADMISHEFINHVLSTIPNYLGQGVWLSDSYRGNLHSAIALATPKVVINYKNLPVKILITLSYADENIKLFLRNLNQLLQNQKIEMLLQNKDSDKIISLLTSTKELISLSSKGLTKNFIIRNPYGLHTRPSTLLVNTIKKFNSTITVANLDSTSIPINGRSLIKIITLGATKGQRLQIHAQGLDAVEAMSAITQAINNGLGEEII